MISPAAPSLGIGERACGKISRRIIPYLFVVYIVAYLDRANVTFAKLPMLADLRFSEAVFGTGAGIFFLGYFLLEIPGALIVERWSARLWIARILVSWGLFTVLVGFVRTPAQFYGARFLLGLAEAGFFPGVIVYLTHWFPQRHRARAMSGFILAVPLSFLVGAPLSAWCLSLNLFGLPGWRWIFILQGLPAIVLGIITPFYLTDHPAKARWLAPEEREWILRELEHERQAKRTRSHQGILRSLLQPNVLTLAAALCLIVLASYGYLFWLPTTIQKASAVSISTATLLSGLPFILATASVWYMGRSSDGRRERKLHTAIPLVLAGTFFGLTTIPGQPFALTMIWLCLTAVMLWAWAPSFWVLPTIVLGESAAAASIGLVNSIGNLGGFLGPMIVGTLLAGHLPYSFAVYFLSGAFLLAALLILSLRLPREVQ
jgi:ACS family tartrate transporter-like MFS transporter